MAMQACAACGWSGSPSRLWCPRCGADRWHLSDVLDGTVAAATQVRRADGSTASHVALIALDGADFVIARHDGALSPGSRVRVARGAGCLEAVAAG